MVYISDIHARQILDSRGNPTVEVDVLLSDGIIGRAAVPSGASTGEYEAYELRDGNNSLYRGLSVQNAISNVNIDISNTFSGRNPFEQNKIDQDLIELDGTNNKNKLGANAMLGFSMAVAKSAALSLNVPLYQYLGGIRSNTLPVPMMNIINGGAHANNGLDFQECMIMPIGFSNFSDALRAGTEVFHNLKQILSDKGYSVAVGDEGGFAPDVNNLDDALANISDAIEKSGYKLGEQIYIAIDAAASELFDGQNYFLKGENKKLNTDQLVKYWEDLCKKFPVISIEDPFDENDWNGFKELTKKIGKNVQIVGDDLFVTNKNRLLTGIENNSANSILIKLNQIGTLSETIETIELAKNSQFGVIVSHRSGETEDVFISDLSVGLNTGQIKTGSVSRTDRTAKYNQLIRIEEMLGSDAKYFGKGFFDV
ncbi:MAG: phosphopyruvate hydratase [Alphaproteobacteria bacterium]|jgi:enolase|nr:phosphopyruvate hydratase [Alphaproteobacteria bacterium]MDB2583712.1 phosphopyruvate hydratase [Alphaproteobacteria bacterium]